MLAEGSLVTFLLADGTVSGLVAARMYPILLPQEPSYPAIVYSLASSTRLHALDGPPGRASHRVQIDCYAETYKEAHQLAAAVRQRLDGYAGLMGSTEVGYVSLDNEQDLYDDDARVHRVLQDFLISHKEA